MKHRLITLAASLALVVSACGGAEEAATTTTRLAAVTTSQTEASTATTAAATTTSQVALTTTTTTEDAAASARPGTLGASVLAQTPDLTATSGRFEVSIQMIGDGTGDFGDELTLTMSGAFAANGDSEIFMDFGNLLEAGASSADDEIPEEFLEVFAEPMHMKTIGDKAHMKGGFFAMFLGTDKWIETESDESAEMTSSFGFGADGNSPTELLDAITDTNAEIEEIGREDVRGVETTHYRAILDIRTLAEGMTADEHEQLETDLGELDLTDFPIDIWVGDDGLVYRYSMTVDAAAAGGETEGLESLTMSFEMWDYGSEVVIEPPPADEIATADEIGFNFGSG